MKKKLTLLLSLGCLSFLALGLVACKKPTKLEEYQDQGYKISVTYDANGGSFLNRPGISIMDLFKPEDYTPDVDGTVRIKLLEPTDGTRPSGRITLTKPEHFFAGWYQTREVKTVDGTPEAEGGVAVDETGKELEKLEDGTYVYADDEKAEATPAYIYSDYWDFEQDRVEYTADDEVKSITLYAGWVPYYQFDYYYEVNGQWTLFGTTTFDYKTTNAEGSSTFDKDTIWVPTWQNGAMSHVHSYNDASDYEFPKVAGMTFSKAYTDKACTAESEITDSFEHEGTLELETCEAVNRTQDVYVVFDVGERYKIETAAQLQANANSKGIYEILADLDFSEATWPTAFASGTFEGQMYSTAGQTYTLRNISAKFASTTSTSGGLFGTIAAGAVVKDLVFENVTTDISSANGRLRNVTFGAFAGNIEDNASVVNVTFGGMLKIGAIKLDNGYSINLLANGNVQGITKNAVKLQIYGTRRVEDYKYTVQLDNPAAVQVDANGNVTLMFTSLYTTTQESFDIELL